MNARLFSSDLIKAELKKIGRLCKIQLRKLGAQYAIKTDLQIVPYHQYPYHQHIVTDSFFAPMLQIQLVDTNFEHPVLNETHVYLDEHTACYSLKLWRAPGTPPAYRTIEFCDPVPWRTLANIVHEEVRHYY